MLISGTFVSLILRTRLRWVLGGPVRAEQRAEYDALRATSVVTDGQSNRAGENAHRARRLTSDGARFAQEPMADLRETTPAVATSVG